MNRFRLATLVACALLSTSIQPFGWPHPNSLTEADPIELTPPAVSAPPPQRLEQRPDSAKQADASGTVEQDQGLTAKILRRLSIHHTGLTEPERVELARTIIQEARARDLDPDLVIAVIEVESACYHLAVSRVGAMGLMQLLPATGEEFAGKLGIEWMGKDILFDPIINVKLGTAYLRELADRYGDMSVALAAYNWGPGRIDRRLRRGSKVPSAYIKQVMRAYERNLIFASQRS
ncbi:MAG: lytic transglycosylase domain-containing protein [Myxococcota bacterium]